MLHHFRRAAATATAALALASMPAPATAQASPAPARTVAGSTAAPTSAEFSGTNFRRCPRVEPWTGPVPRCSGSFSRHNQRDLLVFDGIWAPHFEPALNGIGRSGSYFVYVGRTPVGWVELDAVLGGTITLATEYGEYRKGTQRIALYTPRGRLVAWDWITLDWDW